MFGIEVCRSCTRDWTASTQQAGHAHISAIQSSTLFCACTTPPKNRRHMRHACVLMSSLQKQADWNLDVFVKHWGLEPWALKARMRGGVGRALTMMRWCFTAPLIPTDTRYHHTVLSLPPTNTGPENDHDQWRVVFQPPTIQRNHDMVYVGWGDGRHHQPSDLMSIRYPTCVCARCYGHCLPRCKRRLDVCGQNARLQVVLNY